MQAAEVDVAALKTLRPPLLGELERGSIAPAGRVPLTVIVELPPAPKLGAIVPRDAIELQPERNSVVILGTVRAQYGHGAKPGAELLPLGAAAPEPDPPPRHPALPPAAGLLLHHLLPPCRFCFDGYILHVQQWARA